jgi:steroid delta-isomerase-like uncharacterized protein
MHQQTDSLIRDYYAAFNRQDMSHFLSLLSDDVVHDINQGSRESGKSAFASFMKKMNAHYREQIVDLIVLSEPSGKHASVEFTVVGEYLKTDDDLPAANGQTYRLRAGAFFDITDNRISRVTNYYNLPEWIAQVSA